MASSANKHRMACSPKASRKTDKADLEPPFKTMTTKDIYRKIDAKGPLKHAAVRDIFIDVMKEAINQAKHHGTFELASMLVIKVETISAKGGRHLRKSGRQFHVNGCIM